MIFQRALGYEVFKERNPQSYVGLGVVMALSGAGGSGPPSPTATVIFARDGTVVLDRNGDGIETRV